MKTLFSVWFPFYFMFGLFVYQPPDDPEVMPTPVGGMKAIAEHIIYPETAKINKLEGKVLVKALIDEKGNVTSTEMVESLSIDCDKAAVDAIKKVKFNPAIKDGKKIKCEVVIPVQFKLQQKTF
jgi:TonB family protein